MLSAVPWLRFSSVHKSYLQQSTNNQLRETWLPQSTTFMLTLTSPIQHLLVPITLLQLAPTPPTMPILSRIHLSQIKTGAEQERVFSSAKHAVDKDQTRMDYEMMQMRTLLSHNKQLIRRGIISIHD